MEECKKARVTKLDYFGKGIVKDSEMVVFIPNALPEEEILFHIVNKKKKFAEGVLDKIISPSKNREESICSYSSKCGGCDLIHLKYVEQLKYKEQKIKELFARNFNYDITVHDIVPTSQLNYRNKITLHVNGKKLGLYEEKSNHIIQIDSCIIVNSSINLLIPRLKEWIATTNCRLESIVIKCNLTGEILLSFIGKIDKNLIKKEWSDVHTIYLNNKLIKGLGYIEETIGKYTFKISNKSFFQVNTYGAELLYNEVLQNIENGKYNKVLDLYCGTGTISILISKYVKEVIGVEVEKNAFTDAKESAKLNKIENVKFINDKVENCMEQFSNIDMIIVDPPRDGLARKVVDSILKIGPNEILYVSCDPISLIRDLKILGEKYQVMEVTPVDMFSNTHHVETVVLMARIEK